MKNQTWTSSWVLFLLGAILLIGSLLNLFYEKHYIIAGIMLISAFANFTDGLRRRKIEKTKIQE